MKIFPFSSPIKNQFQTFLLVSVLLITFGCQKENTKPEQRETAEKTDSLSLIMGKWSIIKDSVSTSGNFYIIDDGSTEVIIPDVYYGKKDDYYDFEDSTKVVLHENGFTGSSYYKICGNSKLMIDEMYTYDSGNIVLLKPTAAIFDWTGSSPNGGKYFKRVYLKK